MTVSEDKLYSAEYLDPDKRSIANRVNVKFNDGTETGWVEVEYPIGHRFRREEGIRLLEEKYYRNLRTRFSEEQATKIENATNDLDRLCDLTVPEFVDLTVI